jgi:hypothetical protein
MTGLSLFIAQVPTDPAINIPLSDPRFLAVLIVVGFPVLLNMINGVLSVVKFFKADPATHQIYATKEELEDVETRLNNKLEIDANELKNVEARLVRSQRDNKTEIQQHLNTQDKFSSALQAELKGIHHQLGEITGTLKGMTKR